ncbi:hypothetical protein WH96_03580 [Kiloniella spongiae]|uniref:Uncharacterized protein n=1 Tax=Kiloniella spongiae TaxID=1489064 RepID=A0A0H2N198_9PROT|nr:hypothetical protein WH96_03580 [Kiloniella spongiae]
MTDKQISDEPKIFRLIYAVPLIGSLFKELLDPNSDATLYFLLNVVLLWIFSGAFWGLQGVFAVALGLVPVMFIVILRITLGKVPVSEADSEQS